MTHCKRAPSGATMRSMPVACEVEKSMALARARGKATAASLVAKARSRCPCASCRSYRKAREGLRLVKRAR